MTDYYWVYCTTATKDQALEIGRILVSERLAACINVLPEMISCYHWNDQMMEDTEAVLIAKTTAEQVENLTRRIKELHSYEVPCVLAIPIASGNEDFLVWVKKSVQS
jgi:periplasmic divalent cation tolerance protein